MFEKLGEWYLPIVDIVSQSLDLGFVGTLHSTFSLLIKQTYELIRESSLSYFDDRCCSVKFKKVLELKIL